MTTIHAYTNDQVTLDFPHKDLRRARAAGDVDDPHQHRRRPKAIGLVMPDLQGKLDGFSMRVPTSDVSVVDLSVKLKKSHRRRRDQRRGEGRRRGPDEGRAAVQRRAPASRSTSSATPTRSILDALSTKVMDGNFAKVLSWYDNEWGYSNRVVDLASKIGG